MPWEKELDRKVRDYLPDLALRQEEPMQEHCSFRVGGPARRMAFPKNGEQLVILLQLAEECGARPIILGKGSNILPPDGGMDRLVIGTSGLAALEAGEDGSIMAEAGVPSCRRTPCTAAGHTSWRPTAPAGRFSCHPAAAPSPRR